MLTTKPATEPQPYVVLRPFFFAGAVQPVGARVDLVPSFAAEMLAAGKVQPAPAAEAAPEVVPEPAAPVRAARKSARA